MSKKYIRYNTNICRSNSHQKKKKTICYLAFQSVMTFYTTVTTVKGCVVSRKLVRIVVFLWFINYFLPTFSWPSCLLMIQTPVTPTNCSTYVTPTSLYLHQLIPITNHPREQSFMIYNNQYSNKRTTFNTPME